jgi:hypothetical protein
MGMVLLPLDYETRDVRWPAQQSGAQQRELEGRRVLVPVDVFAQEGRERYAGVIKHARKGACVFFPIDGKELRFPTTQARKWLVAHADAKAAAEWERLTREPVPRGWPAEVLFCSFPVQRGLHQSLLKRMCTTSQLMEGVEIREVPRQHACCGSSFSRALYATAPFKRGDVLGQCESLLPPSPSLDIRRAQQRRILKGGRGAINVAP